MPITMKDVADDPDVKKLVAIKETIDAVFGENVTKEHPELVIGLLAVYALEDIGENLQALGNIGGAIGGLADFLASGLDDVASATANLDNVASAIGGLGEAVKAARRED
jgi:hypothetical protein